MKIGQAYRMTNGSIYMVVSDYGKMRPLMIDTFEMNASWDRCPAISAGVSLSGFYPGDELVGSASISVLDTKQPDKQFWFK